MVRIKRFLRKYWLLVGIIGLALVAVGTYGGIRLLSRLQSNSSASIRQWFDDPSSRAGLITPQQFEPCRGAPFILPTSGLIGLLWGDPAGPYSITHRHSGLDIFGDGAPGTVPVYAAYDGYLSRLPDWRSTVIIRHDDPLQPGRVIWTYYTHMASRDGQDSYIVSEFPRGSTDIPVAQGTLLGYQGEYSGNDSLVGLHLHFSIVLSEPDGTFKNEALLENTLDPSPYLGMTLNIASLPERPIRCAVR